MITLVRKTTCMAAMLTFLAATWPTPASAADDEQEVQITGNDLINVLQMLAARNEANYRKIETWRGKYRFIDQGPWILQQPIDAIAPAKNGPQPPPKLASMKVNYIREGTIEFALDIASDKLFSRYLEDESKTKFLSLDRTEVVKPYFHLPADERLIITAERIIKLTGNLKLGPLKDFPDDPTNIRRSSSLLAEVDAYPPREREKDNQMRLDPRRFYAFSGEQIWEELRGWAAALAGDYGDVIRSQCSGQIKLTKIMRGDLCDYKLATQYVRKGSDGKPQAWQFACFAEHYGFLPTEQQIGYIRDNKNRETKRRTWVYQKTSGILIPKEFHFTQHDGGDFSLMLDRHLVLLEAVLNEPIPPEVFAVENMGLAKSDRVVDKVENRLLVSDGKKLVPAASFWPLSSGWLWLWWINTILLAILVAWYFARRYRRARSSLQHR